MKAERTILYPFGFFCKEVSCSNQFKMKSIVFAILMATVAVVANAQTAGKEFSISGKIKNPVEGGTVYLELAGTKPLKAVDSTKIVKGAFSFKGKETDGGTFYNINISNRQRIVALVEGGETLEVVADGFDKDKNGKKGVGLVTGSKNNEYYYNIMDLYENITVRNQKLQERYAAAEKKKDAAAIQKVMDEGQAMEQEMVSSVKAMIPELGTSLAALFATNFLSVEKDFETINALAMRFEKENPDTKQAKIFVGNIKRIRGVQVGGEAPEITLNNVEGKPVNLSSLRGKYVLIDFWASWCGPCRMENPNVVKTYNRYKEKGFDVFSVSLDRDKEAWMRAIAKDGLLWTSHVSDLKYWQSAAAQLYGVSAIPATFLLDKEGKIISKNLRGEALEQKLAELMK